MEGFSHDLDRRSDYERDSKSALRHLESFCHRVADRLDNMSFEERQEILRLVVDRFTVETGPRESIPLFSTFRQGWLSVSLSGSGSP